MKLTRTVVEFYDITVRSDEWFSADEAKDALPLLCSAEGVVIFEDDNFLKLAPLHIAKSEHRGESAGVLILIPKGCITSRRDI